MARLKKEGFQAILPAFVKACLEKRDKWGFLPVAEPTQTWDDGYMFYGIIGLHGAGKSTLIQKLELPALNIGAILRDEEHTAPEHVAQTIREGQALTPKVRERAIIKAMRQMEMACDVWLGDGLPSNPGMLRTMWGVISVAGLIFIDVDEAVCQERMTQRGRVRPLGIRDTMIHAVIKQAKLLEIPVLTITDSLAEAERAWDFIVEPESLQHPGGARHHRAS